MIFRFGTLAAIPAVISPSANSGNPLCEGGTLNLTSNITGGKPPVTYSWSGPNAFSSNLQNPSIPNATPLNAGTYILSVTDGYGCTPVTASTTAIIYSTPTASISGTTAVCLNAASPLITFTGANGTAPYTFTYTINGSGSQTISTTSGNSVTLPVPTGTSGTFLYTMVSVSDANLCTHTLTGSATVTVNPLPSCSITGNPTICVNETTNLSPTSGGTWVSNNPSVASVTDAGLVTGLTAGSATFTFTQTATGCSNTTSAVTVNALPIITTQPTDKLDCEGHIVSFNVVATGSGLTYTWQRKYPSGSFADIPIEPNVSYPAPGTIRLENVGNADAPDGTQYRVVISNSDNCTVTSTPATLTVNEITDITPRITKDTICQGDNYSYLVTTSYAANVVSYQWKKWITPGTWVNVIDGGAISGATTSHLVFTGATPSESGQYKVTVVFHSSGADCNVTSDTRNRTLTVNPTPSCAISGDISVFAGSTNNSYTSTSNPSDNVLHFWSVSGNGTITGSTTGSTVTMDATSSGTFTLTDAISRFGCTSSCSYTVSVIDLPCSVMPTTSVTNGSSTVYNAPDGMDTYSWSLSGNGTSISGTTGQTVTVLAGNSCDTYTLTLTITKNGASSTCSQTISVTDNQPPTFTPPGPFTDCVENLFSAAYISNGLLINPDPDYYLFRHGDIRLNLDLSKFIDNCCIVPTDFVIRWAIVFSTGEPTISGTGQPSTYGSDIKLWGDGVAFTTLTHTIRYWLKDCNGKEILTPIEQTITIKPRPQVN